MNTFHNIEEAFSFLHLYLLYYHRQNSFLILHIKLINYEPFCMHNLY